MGTTARLIALSVLFAAAGCDKAPNESPEPQAAADAATVAAAPPTAELMQKWSRSCVLCHVDGNGGAPRLGNAADWAPRLAQGRDTLLQHTLEGLNNMPPLGYCMSCERDDFIALIDFMAGGR